MDDLISRQAAIDAINHICPVDTEYDCTLLDRVDVRCVLSDLPTAQPELSDEEKCLFKKLRSYHNGSYAKLLDKMMASLQPERNTGRWININDGKWNTIPVYKCSACGEIGNRVYETDNYCPNCGSKMEV